MKKDNWKVIYIIWICAAVLIVCLLGTLIFLLYIPGQEKATINERTENTISETTEYKKPEPADITLQVFRMEDVTYSPDIPDSATEDITDPNIEMIYDKGIFGGSECKWMGLLKNGIYFMYAVFDEQEADHTQYVILSEDYSAPCGISVGMNEQEVLTKYPNIAVVDFDGDCISGSSNSLGFNGGGFPHGTDDKGETQYWCEQFDYCMLAEVETVEEMPYYMVLFVRDGIIAGISFEYPTAG